MSRTIQKYFKRYVQYPHQIEMSPSQNLGMVVVIPCYNEPDLLATLDSLKQAEPPASDVEVLVVINSSTRSPQEHLDQNLKTQDDATLWMKQNNTEHLQVHVLWHPSLPHKTAGVGTARKIGMDEAVSRLNTIGKPQGLMVCLDADCTVAPNYLTAIEEEFTRHPKASGAAISYEHPLEQTPDNSHLQAIEEYELHLRYYVRALHFAGIQHACHTVGSTMVVRAENYCQLGGMNRRKAGEDFYFMVKLAKTNASFDLTQTTVFPSPRISLRVPFGTGKAIHSMTQDEQQPSWPTYAPASFLALRQVTKALQTRFSSDPHEDQEWLDQQDENVRLFFTEQELVQRLDEIRRNTTSESSFQRRLSQWLDPFVAMKWVHFSRDNGHPNVSVSEAATWLLNTLEPSFVPPTHSATSSRSTTSLLQAYRDWDRENPLRPTPQ